MTEVAATELETSLAGFAANLALDDVPTVVVHEAKRSILNVLATAFAGCREPAIDKTLKAMTPLSAGGSASLFGREEQCDPSLAAFVNAMAANIFDYDDNHSETIIHPAAPLAPALFAFAETERRAGADLLRAFIIGGEIECRIGLGVSPYHYARGWHITSTCGIFGAASGVGALLGLTERQFVDAMANAAALSAGLVENLGTMAKSLSVGGAARHGMLSAILAADDFTGSSTPLSGERGFLNVFGEAPDMARIVAGLGEDWEIGKNTYKPYPVGVVLNPVIDACLELAGRPDVELGAIKSIRLTGHPLLRQRTDRPDVATGREAQVSAQHAVAIVLRRRAAGLDEFDDAAVAETLAAGRPTVEFVDDATMHIAEAKLSAFAADGTEHEVTIDAASGSPDNPLSDSDLEAKLTSLAERSGFSRPLAPLIDAIWRLDELDDAAQVPRLAREQRRA